MNSAEAFIAIDTCVKAISEDFDGELTLETDLVGEEILDSLDSMNFLFDLEQHIGVKIPQIDEDYDDFMVGSLVELIVQATS